MKGRHVDIERESRSKQALEENHKIPCVDRGVAEWFWVLETVRTWQWGDQGQTKGMSRAWCMQHAQLSEASQYTNIQG